MTNVLETYPTVGNTNEHILFSTLGSFWNRAFADKAVLHGITISSAEELCQQYYDLIEAVDSYSAEDIHIFKKIKWFPILIKKSDVNTSLLRFGEGIKFGETVLGDPYIFGKAPPQEAEVFNIQLPDNLKEVHLITNRVISPSIVLLNNLDIWVKGDKLFFYGDPFKLSNTTKSNLVNTDGTPVYFNHPLTGQLIPDELLILWAYNSGIETDSVNNNIGYLFGINMPVTKSSKDLFQATVKLFSEGPSVFQLKALCSAFLGLRPTNNEIEQIEDIYSTDTHNVVVTNSNVYRYPIYYNLSTEYKVGDKVSKGTVFADAVEYYDSVIFKDWWLSRMTPKISKESGTLKSPAYTLPPYMFAGNYKYGLTFKNSLELITRGLDGNINFPVIGAEADVKAFNEYINQNKDTIAETISPSFGPGSSMLINPLDFLFRYILQNNTALLKVNFETEDQLKMFTQYYNIIRDCLPKHVYFIFFFDIAVPSDVYDSSAIKTTQDPDNSALPGDVTYIAPKTVVGGSSYSISPGTYPLTLHTPTKQEDGFGLNNFFSGNSGGLVKECILVRNIPVDISTLDYNSLDITRPPL